MLNFNLERFNILPKRAGVTWRGGLIEMPIVVEDDHGKPVRPTIAFWADAQSGVISPPAVVEEGEPFDAVLEALIEFSQVCKFRPATIEVTDGALATQLEETLAGATHVMRVDSLPALDEFERESKKVFSDGPAPDGALTGRGVGVPQMRSFAEAAARFYRAGLWEELTGDDLIVVELPEAPAGMRYVSVLGYVGETYGLGFYDSLKQYEKMVTAADPTGYFKRNSAWTLLFDDAALLPGDDETLWIDHSLPVAGDAAYPFLGFHAPKQSWRRPDAGELAFVDGLLRALANTSGAQLDQGRWSRRVNVGGKRVEYRLALVDELNRLDEGKKSSSGFAGPKDMRGAMEKGMAEVHRLLMENEFESDEEATEFINEHFNSREHAEPAPRNDRERAQELIYDAWDAQGRRRRLLAKDALKIDPDCADAYVLLAEDAGKLSSALELLRKGVAAGGRALGPAVFKECAGDFWSLLETRPYMRARFELARCLCSLGQREEAVTHYEELLRLNPNDNQGVRYLLAACLLQLGDGDRLESLFRQYEDEPSAEWMYARALWAYRKEGDSEAARKIAREAVECNDHVPAFLSGKRRLPSQLPVLYQLGNEDEAVLCAAGLMDDWCATPGAVEWLAKQQPVRRKKKSKRRKR